MQETNDYINSLTYNIVTSGINVTTDKKMFKDAIFADLDLSVGLTDLFYVGPRFGIEYCFPASCQMDGTFNTTIMGMTLNYSGRYTDTLDAVLIPLEAGLTSKFTLPGLDFEIKLGAYAGYGLAIVGETRKVEISGGDSYIVPIPYYGGNFMADGFASLDFAIAPFMTIELSGGYRLARIPQVKASASAANSYLGMNIAKDMPLTDLAGKDIFVDFSGYNVGLGLNIGF